MSLPQQFDWQAGVDLSTLSTIEKEQLLQSINQAGPLSNIGGILAFSSDGGSIFPNLGNNPRFSRYLWIDLDGGVATLKIHNQLAGDAFGNWIPIGLSDDAVLGNHIAAQAVAILDGATPKIALNEDKSATDGSKGYILRVNSAGTLVEVVPINTAIPAGTLSPGSLIPGANGEILTISSGAAVFAAIDFAAQIAAGDLSPNQIAGGGSQNWFLRQGVGGNLEIVTNDDSAAAGGLFPAKSINPTKLAQASAATGQALVWDGNNWAPSSSGLNIGNTVEILSGTFLLQTGVQTIDIAHGLGAIPRLWRVVFRIDQSFAGYSEGDEVDAVGFSFNVLGAPLSISADATNVRIAKDNAGNLELAHKDGTATPVPIGTDNIKPKLYAWK